MGGGKVSGHAQGLVSCAWDFGTCFIPSGKTRAPGSVVRVCRLFLGRPFAPLGVVTPFVAAPTAEVIDGVEAARVVPWELQPIWTVVSWLYMQ